MKPKRTGKIYVILLLVIVAGIMFLMMNDVFAATVTPTLAVTPTRLINTSSPTPSPTPTRRRLTPTPTRIPLPTTPPGSTPGPTLPPGVDPVLDLRIFNYYPAVTASVNVSPPGVSVTASTKFTYPLNTIVTLTVKKSVNGNMFYGWSGDVTGDELLVQILMDRNKTVGATFISPTITPRQRITPTRRIVLTPTPTPIGDSGYAVNYTIQSDWGSGGTVNVTITNRSASAVNGWTLAWTFPGNQTITSLWSGTFIQSGAGVVVKDGGFNANIPANGGVVNFGFNMNYSGVNTKPASFTLNGSACQIE